MTTKQMIKHESNQNQNRWLTLAVATLLVCLIAAILDYRLGVLKLCAENKIIFTSPRCERALEFNK